MKEIIVVVVQYKKKILLLKRQQNKRYDPGKWEFVSGFVNKRNLKNFAKERVLYETGLRTTFIKKGDDFKAYDEYGKWLIHPFLFSSDSENVQLREDHEKYEWIEINKLSKFNKVHDLEKNLIALNLS